MPIGGAIVLVDRRGCLGAPLLGRGRRLLSVPQSFVHTPLHRAERGHVFSTIISNNQPRANKKQVSVQRRLIIQRYVGLTKHLAQVCCRRLLFVLPCLHPNTEATSYSERVPPELVGEVILLGVVVPVVLPHVHCGVLNTLCLSIWERASSSTGLCVHCACLHNRPLGYEL